MATSAESLAASLIRQVSSGGPANDSDRELLRRFLEENDASAFEVILRRHGPMVLSVCRSVLGNTADAEDAFQATFFVLVRRGRALEATLSMAGWLHRVAYRTALKARGTSARRRENEPAAPVPPVCDPDQLDWAEVQAILHEELNQLPDRYRQPLVLCYLQGKTQAAAAELLKLSKGTVRRRLDRARALLGARLVRRGVGPAAVLLAATGPAASSAAVPVALFTSTLKVASGTVLVSAPVRVIAEGVMSAMFRSNLKKLTALLLSPALLVGVLLAAGSEPGSAAPTETIKPVASVRPSFGTVQLPRFEFTAAPVPKKEREERILFWLDDKPVLLKPDGTEIASKDVLPAELLGLATGNAALSPTGTHIAFGHQINGFNNNPYILHVLELDGKKRLTKIDGLHLNTHHWMGSGDKLYLYGQPVDKRNDISDTFEHWIYELSTGKKQVVKLHEDFVVRAISPDGKVALADEWKMTETKWHTHAHLLSFDGGKPTPLLELNQDVYNPTPQFSPDGKRLLCEITHYGKYEPAPEKGKWAFKNSDFRFRNLFVVDLATKKKTVLKEYGEKPTDHLYGLAWSPDGKRIAFVEMRYEDEKRVYRVLVADPDAKNAKEIYKAEGNRVVGFGWR